MKRASDKMKVLFLCTGNTCRSQMAEAWARELAGDRIDPCSAGVAPGRLDPRAVRVMAEVGIDISRWKPKQVDLFLDRPLDLVVTVCSGAGERCPLFPGSVRLIHRGFDDPPALAVGAKSEEEALGHYRRVRDEIRRLIEDF